MLKVLAAVLCIGFASAAPWPFSMWRKSQNKIDPPMMTLPVFGKDIGYHTSSEFADGLTALASSCKGLTVETKEDNGIKIEVARFLEPGEEAKYKTMVVANEHARELITGEIALNFVKGLCGQARIPRKEIQDSKKDTEFLVVVNANPSSRSLVETGDFCTRVNQNKVDINRNFDANYADAEKTNADTNPGEHAFDQPESRILKDLMESFKPHFYLDLHAGFRGMFFPNDVANDPQLSTQLQRLFAPVDEAHCKCPLGVANKEVGYHTAGSALDYSFSVLKVPVSMAVEVYLNDEATDEIAALEERWDKEKGELLKPLKTGSSFMENGVSADTIIPMPVIPSVRDLMQQNGEKMTPDQCMKYFNPVKKESYMQTLKSWTVAIAEMSIKSREIKKDAAFVALNKGSSFTELRPPMHQVQQSAAGEPPVWFALKVLGLLFLVYLVYVAIKYYKTKQSKSAEAAPLAAQMSKAPVQVSD